MLISTDNSGSDAEGSKSPSDSKGPSRETQGRRQNWAAVKKVKLSYHNMDICIYIHHIIWFLNYGNLISVP